jgi:hypothetical protein
LARIKQRPPTIGKLDLPEKVRNSSLKTVFGAEAIEKLIKENKFVSKVISPHSALELKGSKAKVYIIIRGTLIEKAGGIEDNSPHMMLHESEILGFQNILP